MINCSSHIHTPNYIYIHIWFGFYVRSINFILSWKSREFIKIHPITLILQIFNLSQTALIHRAVFQENTFLFKIHRFPTSHLTFGSNNLSVPFLFSFLTCQPDHSAALHTPAMRMHHFPKTFKECNEIIFYWNWIKLYRKLHGLSQLFTNSN